MLKIKLLSTTLNKFFVLIILIAICQCFFLPKLTTRFCYNSSDPARVNSQCVYCNYYLFDSVSALTVNITATQAFCVISQCLGQIRQAPVFLGRRRKREIKTSYIEFDQLKTVEKKHENQELDDQNKLIKQVEKPNESIQTTSIIENSFSYEEEFKKRNALIQQEALDELNLAAITSENDEREDEVLETTTEIFEFNLDGEKNKYIVKKEVQAVIIDMPDSLDTAYSF